MLPEYVIGTNEDLQIYYNPQLNNYATKLVCAMMFLPVRDIIISNNFGDCLNEPTVYNICESIYENTLGIFDLILDKNTS